MQWFSPNMALAKHLYFGLVCLKDIVPEVLWCSKLQLCKPKLCCHISERQLYQTTHNCPVFFWLCFLSMSPKTCLRCSSWVFCCFFEHCTTWPMFWILLGRLKTVMKVLVNKILFFWTICRTMNHITLSRFMQFKVVVEVFPPWHCNTNINAPDSQTIKALLLYVLMDT